jgi:hypothetical protein
MSANLSRGWWPTLHPMLQGTPVAEAEHANPSRVGSSAGLPDTRRCGTPWSMDVHCSMRSRSASWNGGLSSSFFSLALVLLGGSLAARVMQSR